MNIIIVFLATKEAAVAIPPTAGQQHGRGKPVGDNWWGTMGGGKLGGTFPILTTVASPLNFL